MSTGRFDRIRELGGEAYAAYPAAGFREWFSRGGPHNTPYLLQKRIRRDGVTLFFVNVWAWDWTDFPQRVPPFSLSAETQFETHGADRAFNVELLHSAGPAETEAFFLRVYDAMGCQPYGD